MDRVPNLPDICPNIRTDTGYLARYPTGYRISRIRFLVGRKLKFVHRKVVSDCQGEEDAGGGGLHLLNRQLQQAGLPVLCRHEACPLLNKGTSAGYPEAGFFC